MHGYSFVGVCVVVCTDTDSNICIKQSERTLIFWRNYAAEEKLKLIENAQFFRSAKRPKKAGNPCQFGLLKSRLKMGRRGIQKICKKTFYHLDKLT